MKVRKDDFNPTFEILGNILEDDIFWVAMNNFQVHFCFKNSNLLKKKKSDKWIYITSICLDFNG